MGSNEDRERLTHPQRRIPDLSGLAMDGSAPGGIVVMLFADSSRCQNCRAYVEKLAQEADELRAWGASLLRVTSDEDVTAELSGVIQARDPAGGFAARLGVQPPCVVIADEWREIHLLQQGGTQHALPSVEEVVEWVRYLGSRCPECEGESF